jgi:hypothetical protein
MIKRLFTLTGYVVAVSIVAVGLIGSVGAQDVATPTADLPSHPAHIHTGTCTTLGDVEFPLENVSVVYDITASPEAATALDLASPLAEGASTLASTTIVETTLGELLGAGHAINVHESAENMQEYIACGDITGTPTDGVLTIDLAALNSSGATGQAMLIDNGDGTISVDIALTHDVQATPVASPAA